jgi:hypothetical protein
LKEILDAVINLRDQGYRDACFAIKKNHLLDDSKYGKCFLEFKKWAIDTSKLPPFIGDENFALEVFNKTNKFWESAVPLKLSTNWAMDIAVLHRWARLSNKDEDTGTKGLINFVMWHQGLSKIKKMISSVRLSASSTGLLHTKELTGDLAHDQLKVYRRQLEHLVDIENKGHDFLKVLEYIAQSHAIEELFQRYKTKFENLVELGGDEAALEIIINELDGYRLWIKSFCEMVLGHYNWEPILNEILSKDKIREQFNTLRADKDKWKSFLNDYKVTMTKSSNTILNLFHQINETIKLRDTLIAFSKNPKQSNPVFSLEGTTLVINTKNQMFSFDTQKIELLEAFLSQTKGIHGITFNGDDFSRPETFKLILAFIARHPELHYLGLQNCRLNSETLECCLEEFSKLKHIHALDLSQNPLISPEVNVVGLTATQRSRIREFVEMQGTLTQLCLNDCGFDEQSKQRMNVVMQSIEKNTGLHCQLGKITNQLEGTVQISESFDFPHIVKLGPPTLMQDLTSIEELKTSLRDQIQHYQMTIQDRPDSQSDATLMSSRIGGFRPNAWRQNPRDGAEEKYSVQSSVAKVKL